MAKDEDQNIPNQMDLQAQPASVTLPTKCSKIISPHQQVRRIGKDGDTAEKSEYMST